MKNTEDLYEKNNKSSTIIKNIFIINILLKSVFYIFCIEIIFKSIKIQKISNFEQDKYYPYFFCFAAIGKKENRYAKEVIDYYREIGVDKFIIADNNDKNSEKFSDIFEKEISDGLIDIIDYIGKNKNQMELYAEVYDMYQSKCNWISFFDFDEFLEIRNGYSTLTIKEYLSEPKFKKCDVVVINWLIYSDNDLVLYDNRSVIQRFTEPLYNSEDNRFFKSIVRGNIRFNPWTKSVSCHRPQRARRTCDSYGNRAKTFNDVLKPPKLDFAYIKHFSTKTAEEFAQRVKRGHPFVVLGTYPQRVDKFFKHNKVTKEKVLILEKMLNRSFPKYHYIFKQQTINFSKI